MKFKFNVYGMTCSACTQAVERHVKKLNGIKGVKINLTSNTLIVDCDESITGEKEIINAVTKAGYKATVYQANAAEKNYLGLRLFLSIPFALAIFYISMGAMWGLPQPKFLVGGKNAFTLAIVEAVLFLPVAIINYKYFTSGFKKLFTLSPNMDSLIATGVVACVVYSIVSSVRIFNANAVGDFERSAHLTHFLQYEGASMILTLVTLGKFFEAKTKLKTGDALRRLKNIAPKDTLVLRDGKVISVDVALVKVGELIIVKEGMAVALDGVVESGEGAVNQSVITGESVPVYKNAGQSVFSGSILESGYLQIRVSATGENSSIAKIISMVEEAGASKAPISSLADKIASVFVPVVIALAIVTFIVHYLISKDFSLAFNYGVSVLVVSCPCALGLATPLAVMLGSGKGAERGVLIRSGEALQKLSTVSIIGFDKTGTVTEGKPSVTDGVFYAEKQDLLSVLYALESKSSHPLAKAVCEYCESVGFENLSASEVENLHGRGVKGTVNGKKYLISNAVSIENLIGEREHEVYQGYAKGGSTPVFLSDGERILAILSITDKIRQGSVIALEQMRANGLKSVMITGDNFATASAVAGELKTDFISDVLPGQKRQKIQELKNEGNVAYVGDGVNDAPALAEATVGIAVASGTDVAIENAEVVLLKNDMRDVVYAVMLGKKCLRIIKENLFWAFFYNCLGIPLAMGLFEGLLGLSLTPAIASAMMSVSSLFVVGNSLRLRYFSKVKIGESKQQENCECNVQSQQNLGECDSACEISNQIEREGKVMKKYIYVNGMMCGHCKARVEKILLKQKGVLTAVVELENQRALIECDGSADVQEMALALTEDGYDFIREENA